MLLRVKDRDLDFKDNMYCLTENNIIVSMGFWKSYDSRFYHINFKNSVFERLPDYLLFTIGNSSVNFSVFVWDTYEKKQKTKQYSGKIQRVRKLNHRDYANHYVIDYAYFLWIFKEKFLQDNPDSLALLIKGEPTPIFYNLCDTYFVRFLITKGLV